MKYKKNKSLKAATMTLVGIAIILVLLILILLRKNAVKEREESIAASLYEESVAASEAESRSIEASIAESLAAVPRLTLSACSDSGLNGLIEDYFNYRLAADTGGLFSIFGRSDSSEDAEYEKQLLAQKEWIRSFDDIEVYTLPGADENSRAGIVKYRINFRRVNTKAPGIMFFYAEKDSSGKWHLCENISKEVRELMEKEFEEARVQEVVDENTIELREALSSDSDLALMYASFMNGEIYADYNLDSEREQEVDLFMNPEDSMLVGK